MNLTNINQVTLLSISFLLLFTAFNTCQNFSSSVLKEDGFDSLGFTSIAVLYLFFGLFSFLSTAIVKKIGHINLALSIGGMCYTFWIICFLLPSYYSQYQDKNNLPWILNKDFIRALLLITAAINGAGAGILWTAQGKFISECACDENKGFFNSYFWAIFIGSQVIGNFIGALVLKYGAQQSTLFIIFSILAISGSTLMCFLQIPSKNVLNDEYQTKEYIIRTFQLLKNIKMLHIIPLIIWSGISMSVYACIFIPLMERTMQDSQEQNPDLDSNEKRNVASLFTIILLGCGEIIGSVFYIGPIRDKYGNKKAYGVLLITTFLAITIVIIYSQNNIYNWLAYIMCFVWGLQDSGLNCLLNCAFGFEFEDNITPFAAYKFVQSISVFIFSQISGLIMQDSQSTSHQKYFLNIYLLTSGSFGIASLFLMLKFDFKSSLQEIEQAEKLLEKEV